MSGGCRIPDCDTGARMATSKLCWTHYQRLRRHGRTENLVRTPPAERYVVDDNGCHVWTGAICGPGYGHTNRGYAHRLAYERSHGPIPPGMTVDHRCFNTLCVNPEHLALLTLTENVKRKNGKRAKRGRYAKCPHRNPDGSIPAPLLYAWRGQKICRECSRIRFATWQRNAAARKVRERQELLEKLEARARVVRT